jgi:hypothetical protein
MARSAASQFSSADSHGLCLPRRSATGLIFSSGIGGGDASLSGGHGPQTGQRQGGVGFNGLKQHLYPNLKATESVFADLFAIPYDNQATRTEEQMAGEKVTRILRAKSSFTPDEIAAMSDATGWDWIYANAKPVKEKLTQVCFTGFSTAEKSELTLLAEKANLVVVTRVTKNFAFLCAGENAGPAKLKQAKDQGAYVLTKSQFVHLLESGEIL